MSSPPAEGALLDLKQYDDDVALKGGRTSQKGLLLPRVHLTSVSSLYPLLEIGYDESTEHTLYVGCMVYNVNENLPQSEGTGVYNWSGNEWVKVTGGSLNTIILASRKDVVFENNTKETVRVIMVPRSSKYKVTEAGNNASSSVTVVSDSDGELVLEFLQGSEYGTRVYTVSIDDGRIKEEISVYNYSLELETNLIRIGENEPFESKLVKAIGGSADWEVDSFSPSGNGHSTWATEPKKDAIKGLTFTSGSLANLPKDVVLKGWIVVRHKDAPVLTKTVFIEQSKQYTYIPKSDYMVVKYYYTQKDSDLDTATEINGTGYPMLDGEAAGASVGYMYLHQNLNFPKGGKDFGVMSYGGDNTDAGGGYESTLIRIKDINEEVLSPRIKTFSFDLYATWFNYESGVNSNQIIQLKVELYNGGEMFLDENEWTNPTGTKVFSLSRDRVVTTIKGAEVDHGYRWGYTKVGTVVYDRETNTCTLLDQ